MLSDTEKKQVQTRLKRIHGQVQGLSRMVEEDRYCVDVLIQIAAVRAALNKVGKMMLGSHVQTCVAHAFEAGDERARGEKIDELLEVFDRYGA